MRELFSMDQKDYQEGGKVFSRDSARGIILKDGKVLLVHSRKYDYYKFPGGGIEAGENHETALCREVLEETGSRVIPESIREFGYVPRRQKDFKDENGIFAQDNFYYFCEIEEQLKEETKLDDYELEEGFTPVWVEPFTACLHNRHCDTSQEGLDGIMVKREAKVLDLVDLEIRRNERREHEKKTLEALGHPEYFEMLDFVREELEEKNADNSGSRMTDVFYSRYDHTKRVFAWVLRLYQKSARKKEIRLDDLIIAAIFHDIGRRKADEQKIPHAAAGVPVTRRFLEEKGYAAERIDYICNLVAKHSDKHLMSESSVDLGLLMLMEADLFDDMGAQGIVMDCMITESRNPDAKFEDCLDHITRYTLTQQENNPMISPEAIALWEEKTKLTKTFVEALKNDLIL